METGDPDRENSPRNGGVGEKKSVKEESSGTGVIAEEHHHHMPQDLSRPSPVAAVGVDEEIKTEEAEIVV